MPIFGWCCDFWRSNCLLLKSSIWCTFQFPSSIWYTFPFPRCISAHWFVVYMATLVFPRCIYRHIGFLEVYIATLCISPHWFSRGVYCHIGFPEVYIGTLVCGVFQLARCRGRQGFYGASSSFSRAPVETVKPKATGTCTLPNKTFQNLITLCNINSCSQTIYQVHLHFPAFTHFWPNFSSFIKWFTMWSQTN